MEEFIHIDIFSTKGVEYLIVISFLLLIIPFWRYLNAPGKLVPAIGFTTIQSAINRIAESIPKGIFLDPTHSWAFLEPSGAARIGVDNFLLSTTGQIKYSKVRQPGEVINRGDVMSVLEQDGKQLKVYSPISGVIKQRNSKPGESGDNLYDLGWLYRVEPENWTRDMQKLLFAQKAEDWIRKEFDRLKDFFAFSTQKYGYNPELVILQDGGELMEQALRQMPEDIWEEFQAEFIDANKIE